MDENHEQGGYIFLQSEFVPERELPSPIHAVDHGDVDDEFNGATVRVIGHDWFGQVVACLSPLFEIFAWPMFLSLSQTN